MIAGCVNADGTPALALVIGGQTWEAEIDTGFNGDLQLPDALRPFVNARFDGEVCSVLAGGQEVIEDQYVVDFPFDGQIVAAQATLVPGSSFLIGTHLLRRYRLDINFPAGTVLLERVP
jgi:predicted aspartyl protease